MFEEKNLTKISSESKNRSLLLLSHYSSLNKKTERDSDMAT